MRRNLFGMVSMVAIALPSAASAFTQTPQTFSELVYGLIDYINLLIPILLALAVVIYMKNTATGIFNLRSGKVDPTWTKGMAWGILALALMVSLWGVLSILEHTFF